MALGSFIAEVDFANSRAASSSCRWRGSWDAGEL